MKDFRLSNFNNNIFSFLINLCSPSNLYRPGYFDQHLIVLPHKNSLIFFLTYSLAPTKVNARNISSLVQY